MFFTKRNVIIIVVVRYDIDGIRGLRLLSLEITLL